MGGGLLLLLLAWAGVSTAAPCTCMLAAAGEAACAPAGGGAQAAAWATSAVRRLRVSGCRLEAAEAGALGGVVWVNATGGGSVRAALLAHMRSLRVLAVRRADVVVLGAVLRGLTRLETLDLAGNRVSDLGGGQLAALTNLSELSLADNRLVTARKVWFAGLRHLRALDLSRNLIAADDDDDASFQPLTSLRRLDLAGNRLTRPPRSFLGGLAQLRELDLSDNNISSLGDGAFASLANLQSLDISANFLRRLSGGAFLGLARLQRLHLASNSVDALDNDVFSDLRSLLFLNLSGNSLSWLGEDSFAGLSRLQTLDISRNGLAAVSPGTLQPLSGLTELVVAGNPLQPGLMVAGTRLTTVEAAGAGLVLVPASLTRSVHVLRLATNMISAVRCGDLDGYPLLHTLDLVGNRVADIEDDALGRLELLSTLLLQDNRLAQIPHSLPAGLLTLVLQGNPIRSVSTGDLQGIPRLRRLSLRRCLVEQVAGGAFSQLQSLQELDLSENPLKSLQGNSLVGPVSLKVLRLSQLRDLMQPPQGDGEMSFPFGSPEHLEVLELDGSPLLARQLLLDTAALAAFRGLQELNLEHDGLESLRSDLLHFLPRLKILRLAGNPWNCQADLLWLGDWLRNNPPLHAGPTCVHPQRLASVFIAALRDGDFEGDTRYGAGPHSVRTRPPTTSDEDVTDPTVKNKTSNTNGVLPNSSAENTMPSTTHTNNMPAVINFTFTYAYTTPKSHVKQSMQSPTLIPSVSSSFYDKVSTTTAKPTTRQHPVFSLLILHNESVAPSSNTSNGRLRSLQKYGNNTTNAASHIKLVEDNEHVWSNTTITLSGHEKRHSQESTKTEMKALSHSTDYKNTSKTAWRNSRRNIISDIVSMEHIENNKNKLSENVSNINLKQQAETFPSNTKTLSLHEKYEITNNFTLNNSLENTQEMKLNMTAFKKYVTTNTTHTITEFMNVHSLNEELAMANNSNSNKVEDLYFMQGDAPTENNKSHSEMQKFEGVMSKNDTLKSFSTADIKPTALHNQAQPNSNHRGQAVDSKVARTSLVMREYKRGSINTTDSSIPNISTPTLPLPHSQFPSTENVTSLSGGHGKAAFFSNYAFSSDAHTEGDDRGGMSHISSSHPGMFVFVVVGMLMAIALATALSHCAKRRRQTVVEYSRQQDIEVRSISSIGDIW